MTGLAPAAPAPASAAATAPPAATTTTTTTKDAALTDPRVADLIKSRNLSPEATRAVLVLLERQINDLDAEVNKQQRHDVFRELKRTWAGVNVALDKARPQLEQIAKEAPDEVRELIKRMRECVEALPKV